MPFPPHVAKNVKEARALYDLVREQGRSGFAGIVQGEQALGARRARRRTTATATRTARARSRAEAARVEATRSANGSG